MTNDALNPLIAMRRDESARELDQRINAHYVAIAGLERRLVGAGNEPSVARMALTRRYAAFAADMVRRAGGDVQSMQALTDSNNIAPLALGAPSDVLDD